MNYAEAYLEVSPTTLAEIVGRKYVMDHGIHQLWHNMPRIAGHAYPVRCGEGDNLMLHAAIYRAPEGSILVCQAGDQDYAVAGGNVCAIAQKRGISGLIVDGMIRDIAEVRANHFPVLARGLIPIPGKKEAVGAMNAAVRCGGVDVEPGDMIVADEEGIVVIPKTRLDEVLDKALTKAAKEASESLELWEAAHRSKVEAVMREKGLADHVSIES